jgi:hypothetical protein
LNEDLATVSSDARLLAIGLSTIADRAGRLEDRPLKIKAQLFPYHNVDITKLLDELDQQGIGFVQRYSVDSKRYIQITNFDKHQKPHPKELESTIPPLGAVEKHGTAGTIHGSAVKSREEEACTETNTGGSSRRNGLRSGSGNGDGNGDLGALGSGSGSGDSAKAGASAASETQTRDQSNFNVWTLGVGKLMSSGMNPDDARSFLGRQCKDFGKESVSDAVAKMLAQEPADPKAYLVAILQNNRKPPPLMLCKADRSLDSVQRGIAERQARRGAVNG